MKGFMYILECSDGSYYTGSTKYLEKRLAQHQAGEGANHTKKHLPVKLVYFEEFDRIDTAFYREKKIQGWSRKKKEALINNMPEKLHDLAKCLNETSHKNIGFDSAQPTKNDFAQPTKNDFAQPTMETDTQSTINITDAERSRSGSDNNIPKGWIETNMGEIVDLAQGVAINKKTDYVLCDKSKGVPLLKINNLVNNTVDHYVDLKLVPQKTILEKDDVVFTRTGQVGWVFTNKFGVLHNNSFKVIPNDGIHKKFIYWFLKQKSVYNYVQKVASGSAQPDLNHGAFKTIEIRLPSDVEEQKAIANILTSFDDKIALLQAQNNTLETTAQTIFKEWFGKYQIGDDLPDGWRVGKLREVTKSVGGTTPSTKNTDFWNGKINWTSPKDLSNSKELFLLKTEKKITEQGLKKISSGLLPIRTLLLSSRAPVGYLSLTNIELAINQGYIAILPDQYLSNNYMYLWLKLNMKIILSSANGSTFLEISKSSFRNIECLIPSEEILKNFDFLVTPIFEKILSNLTQIQTLKKTRDTLLPKLMSGVLRVSKYGKLRVEELKK